MNAEYINDFYFSCNWVKVDGDEYKLHAGVILEVKDDQPTIGVIKEIFVVDGNKVAFKVQSHTTVYQPHYRAYIMDCNPIDKLVWHEELLISSTVHVRTSHIYELSTSFILLPFALCTI